MRGYDSWLEAPYTRAAALEAEFERFCEEHDLEPADEGTEAKFFEWMEELEEGHELELERHLADEPDRD